MSNKKALSIALVSSYPFTKEPGGVKDFILGLKDALKKQGCKVSIIAPGSEDARKEGLVDFVLGMGFRVATDQTEFKASLARKETARKILRTINPDIILINEPFVPSVGHTIISTINLEKDLKRPIIIGQFHASRKEVTWKMRIVEFVARHLVRRPKLSSKTILSLSEGYANTINNNLDGRIAISKTTKDFWNNKLPADYEIIYNGIDTKKLTPEGPKIESWNDDRRTILFAGRHDPRKGIRDLIYALDFLIKSGNKNLKLKITGVGEETKKLQELTQGLGLENSIEFVGILPYAKLIEAYRSVDLLVAPSTGGEGFNRTIVEARSCETLVVCTDIEGHREAIGKDLSVFMAKPNDFQDLAKQILRVLNLPGKEKIAQKSRAEVVKNFDWEIIAQKHLEYYERLKNKG